MIFVIITSGKNVYVAEDWERVRKRETELGESGQGWKSKYLGNIIELYKII